jgi:hypothetical protein
MELEANGSPDVAARVRIYRDVQRDEAAIVSEELVDIQGGLAESLPAPAETEAEGDDPAINSPRRAKWLAEQAAEAERLKAPMSRRDLLGHGPTKPEDSGSSPA